MGVFFALHITKGEIYELYLDGSSKTRYNGVWVSNFLTSYLAWSLEQVQQFSTYEFHSRVFIFISFPCFKKCWYSDIGVPLFPSIPSFPCRPPLGCSWGPTFFVSGCGVGQHTRIRIWESPEIVSSTWYWWLVNIIRNKNQPCFQRSKPVWYTFTTLL